MHIHLDRNLVQGNDVNGMPAVISTSFKNTGIASTVDLKRLSISLVNSEPGYSDCRLCSGLDLSGSAEIVSRRRERGMDSTLLRGNIMDWFADSGRISNWTYSCGPTDR